LKDPISKVHIITTGGTIEKSYDELDGTLENRTSIIRKEVIDRLRLPYRELDFHPILAKDSLHMTDSDRDVIVSTVQSLLPTGCPILILHGTDTMTVTAEAVYQRLPNPAIPIVFTGAMRPIGFENTDALQNVTEALLATTLLTPGVYLSFHGRVFTVPGVKKDRDKRTFIEV
jgi:L-asparaginase